MQYTEIFEAVWADMCDENGRAEFDEYAKGSAFLMWQLQQERIDDLEAKATETVKFNINKKEVEDLLAFINETGHKTVTLSYTSGGIGGFIEVQKTHEGGEKRNITNVECW